MALIHMNDIYGTVIESMMALSSIYNLSSCNWYLHHDTMIESNHGTDTHEWYISSSSWYDIYFGKLWSKLIWNCNWQHTSGTTYRTPTFGTSHRGIQLLQLHIIIHTTPTTHIAIHTTPTTHILPYIQLDSGGREHLNHIVGVAYNTTSHTYNSYNTHLILTTSYNTHGFMHKTPTTHIS